MKNRLGAILIVLLMLSVIAIGVMILVVTIDSSTMDGTITYTCYSGTDITRSGEGIAYNIHPSDMWAIYEKVDGVDTVVYLPRVSCILESPIEN